MNNVQEKAKKSNKKVYITFAVVLLFCFIGGYFAGRGGASLQESIDAIPWAKVAHALYVPSVVLFVAMVVCAYTVCFGMYAGVGKKLAQLETLEDEEFEEQLPEVEKGLDVILLIAGIVECLSFFFYPLIVFCADAMELEENSYLSVQVLVVMSSVFLVELALFMTIMALVVQKKKKLNLEKQGNVFDFQFRKQWMDSMDEAELMKAAKAAQAAYIAGFYTCFVLWAVSFIAMLTFHTGIMPVVVVSIIMLVLYVVEGVKSL